MGRDTILVTGVSRGIGKAIAARAAEDGYEVIGLSRSAIPGFNGTHYCVDLGDDAAKGQLVEIASKHAPCRVVANAGIARSAPLAEITSQDFTDTMQVNLLSVIWTIQAAVPAMREAGFGRIVTIGSRAALGKAARGVYSASKAGITGLTKTLALELAPDGITINCVAPGPIDTEMLKIGQPIGSPEREALTSSVPLRRLGEAEEIAHTVAYFVSDGAGFTTGQTLNVCGGLTIGGAA
ncbi:SDR family oxidoreductase [Rhodobacteraceae bacterium NNCM2]|nr:SDR family oxidoreductase [Coraliihabitans acroporae]